jgi:hypothetical protein
MSAAAPDRLSSTRALLRGPALAAIAGAIVALWVTLALDGWSYYSTPLRVRGYHGAHKALRPSGTAGHLLGIAGSLVLLSTLAYVARKRWKVLSRRGSVPRWLEVHVFFGTFGPVLITLHTSFKFNGLISVAYWSMLLVMLSGFVGRSLYVRIPKTIRGHELTRAEIESRVAALEAELDAGAVSPSLHEELDRLANGEGSALRRWRTEIRLRRDLQAGGASPRLADDLVAAARDRGSLLRSISRLERRRKQFQVWHVFHRPLVWVMFLILFVHVAVALYFGYALFG